MANADPTMPFDLEQQNQEIQRNRALAQVLLTKSQTPDQGQMISGRYVSPGWGGAINQVVNALASRGLQAKADAQQSAYGTNYSDQLSKGLSGYLDTRSGTPGVEGSADMSTPGSASDVGNFGSAAAEPGTVTNAVPATAPNPRAAVINAMASRIPELQKIGQMDFANQLVANIPKFEKVGDSGYMVTPAGGVTQVIRNEKLMLANGQVIDPNRRTTGGTPQVLGDYRDQFGPVGSIGIAPNGDSILGQVDKSTGAAKFAPKGVAVNVNTQDTEQQALAKKLGAAKVDLLAESQKNALSASKGLNAMDAARQDLEAGIKSGIAANVNLALSKAGQALGIPGSADPTIVNTESYRANMARETLNLVKGLGSGSGISNADRDFAEKASGGLITLDDRSMARLMDVAQAAAGNTMLQHDRLIRSLGEDSGLNMSPFSVPYSFQGGPGVNYDENQKKFVVSGPPPAAASAPKGTAANPMSWQEYQQLQQQRGK